MIRMIGLVMILTALLLLSGCGGGSDMSGVGDQFRDAQVHDYNRNGAWGHTGKVMSY